MNSNNSASCCQPGPDRKGVDLCCGSGQGEPGTYHDPGIIGFADTPAGKIPVVSASLSRTDRWGTFKARIGIGRMHYAVAPGLYGVGKPGKDSPVFVTANYKMSFDRLREVLPGRNAWILVLDTKGINVWCAAGKGTFGTGELASRIEACGLGRVVSHRRLVLPQLGAPGVAAHEVKKRSGFSVIYGPVSAADLPAFIESGYKAEPRMRVKTFTIRERAVLIPVELVPAFKGLAAIVPVFLFLSGLGGEGGYWSNVRDSGLLAASALILAVLGGSVAVPLLLPWLPGRAFSLKGFAAGLVLALLLLLIRGSDLLEYPQLLNGLAWLFMVPALASFTAMNFTGASTYTSLSGVKREMRAAIPFQIVIGAAGLAAWIAFLIVA